jgi:hypothetical protein
MRDHPEAGSQKPAAPTKGEHHEPNPALLCERCDLVSWIADCDVAFRDDAVPERRSQLIQPLLSRGDRRSVVRTEVGL